LDYPKPEENAIRVTIGMMLDDALTHLTGLPAPAEFTPRFRFYALPAWPAMPGFCPVRRS